MVIFFGKRFEFFFAGMQAQLNECGGTVLLGDNTNSEAVMLRPIRFQLAVVWISTNLFFLCIHITVELGYNVIKGTEYFVSL
jgi:hypothetical protein